MRKRFTKDEREAFTPGTRVEWRNVTQWHPGTVAGPMFTENGWHLIPVTNHATTRTVSAGVRIDAGPTCLRLAAESRPGGMPDLDQRREFIAKPVTLDGQPAVICGARNRFATVVHVASAGRVSVEFAWPTVARVVAAGGRFKS